MLLGSSILAIEAAVFFLLHEWAIGGWWELSMQAEEERDSSKRKELFVLGGNIVFAIVVGVTMPVILRWCGWALCFGIFVYIALDMWPGSNKLRASIKVGIAIFCTALFVGAVGNVAHSQWTQEQASLTEGDLRGAREDFNDGKLRGFPFVQIADSTIFAMAPQKPGLPPPPYFRPFPDAEFRTEFGKKGPMVTTVVRDSDGHTVVEIDRNRWLIHRQFCADDNYTDDALEVLDNSSHVVLQIKLLPDRVQLQGEWWDNQGNGLRMSKSPTGNQTLVSPLGPRIKRNEQLINRMFKYPSKDHWREFDK
jgi:hypothetical protein